MKIIMSQIKLACIEYENKLVHEMLGEKTKVGG